MDSETGFGGLAVQARQQEAESKAAMASQGTVGGTWQVGCPPVDTVRQVYQPRAADNTGDGVPFGRKGCRPAWKAMGTWERMFCSVCVCVCVCV